MAWGGKASAAELAAQVKIEFLEKENERLHEQVRHLQDALVAATAPAAYQNTLAMRAAKEPADKTTEEERRDLMALRRYSEEMDRAITQGVFRSADEFIEFMRGGINPNLENQLEEAATAAPEPPGSLHGNNES